MDSVLNGNDMMLGFGTNVRTAIENPDSPTMVKALRQASKNILFTVVRSGNYTIEERRTGMDRMTKTFVTVDVIIAAVLLAIEAAVLIRFRKKKA
jgi:beta-glucosidase